MYRKQTAQQKIKWIGEDRYNDKALVYNLRVARILETESLDYIGDVSRETSWATDQIECYGCLTVAR